jgi:flagellar M-ring protein FliF
MQRRHGELNRLALASESEPGTALVPTATGTAVMIAGQDPAPHTLPRKSAVYEQNMQSLQQIAAEDPRLVAMIVRGWMKKND